jgi:prophage regulatory protein
MVFLRYTQLRHDKGIPWSLMHLGRLEEAGRFPKRVMLGDRTPRWVENEIDAFVAEKLAQRNISPEAA